MSAHDDALVKAMLAHRFRQHEIAVEFFGVNGGRVSEIATGLKFADVSPASDVELGAFLSARHRPH